MSPEIGKQVIHFLDDFKGASSIFFKLKNGSIARAIQDEQKFEDIKAALINNFEKKVVSKLSKEENSLIPYSSSDERTQNSLIYWDLPELPKSLQSLNELFDATKAKQSKYYIPKSILDIDGIVYLLINKDKQIILFKKLSPSTKIMGPRISFFNKTISFVSDTEIRVNGDFDLFLYSNDCIVLNEANFEDAFEVKHIIRDKALKGKELLINMNLISDSEIWQEALNNDRLCRSLCKPESLSLIKAIREGKLTLPTIQEKVREFPDLYGKAVSFGSDGRFAIKDCTSIRKLIKFFNEDFVRSEITGANYDALAKRKI